MPKALLATLVLLFAADAIAASAAGQGRAVAGAGPEVVSLGRQTTPAAESPAVRPEGPNDSFTLTRDAQKELQRLGCYEGEINGFWSPASRAAAQKFLERVNARLPTDKADEVLLALMQSQPDLACNQCPRGQGLDMAGRCMPTALLKQPAAPVATGALPEAPEAALRLSDERTSESQPTEPDNVAAGQKAGLSGYWRTLIRKVDKALGVN